MVHNLLPSERKKTRRQVNSSRKSENGLMTCFVKFGWVKETRTKRKIRYLPLKKKREKTLMD